MPWATAMIRSWGLICLLLAAGPAGHEGCNGAITFFGTKFRADAEERQTHVDGKILGMADIQVIRMGIIGVGEGVQVGL